MIVSAANFVMHINYGKCPLISSYAAVVMLNFAVNNSVHIYLNVVST